LKLIPKEPSVYGARELSSHHLKEVSTYEFKRMIGQILWTKLQYIFKEKIIT
jgi:hypothetical protein